MADLLHQRCDNHAVREAVARCPGCDRFFCRECVTEHEDRVWCTVCLAREARQPLFKRLRLAGLGRIVWFIAMFVLFNWLFFFLCGRILLAIPSSFHEGTFLQRDSD